MNLYRNALILISIILLSCIISVAAGADDIVLESFHYSIGEEMPTKNFDIYEQDDQYYYISPNDEIFSIDNESITQIVETIITYDVFAWDGFSEIDPNVLDGKDFFLEIMFDDDTKITATGSNSFPEDYFLFQQTILTLLEAVSEGNPLVIAGNYYYEPEDFEITIQDNGRFILCQFGNCIGRGEWHLENGLLWLEAKIGNEPVKTFSFRVTDAAIIFDEEFSDDFTIFSIEDGTAFIKK